MSLKDRFERFTEMIYGRECCAGRDCGGDYIIMPGNLVLCMVCNTCPSTSVLMARTAANDGDWRHPINNNEDTEF